MVCEVFRVWEVLCVARERRSSWEEPLLLELLEEAEGLWAESASCSTSTKCVRVPVRAVGAFDGCRETEVAVSSLAVLAGGGGTVVGG